MILDDLRKTLVSVCGGFTGDNRAQTESAAAVLLFSPGNLRPGDAR
jgi:hypothetical protein